MSSEIKVFLLQMVSGENFEENLHTVIKLIQKIPYQKKSALIVTPENCLYFRIQKNNLPFPFWDTNSNVFGPLSQLCVEKNCYLHIGSIPIKSEPKPTSSSLMITPQGNIAKTYSKMHLFDIELENGTSVKESDFFQKGNTPSIIEVNEWKIGQTICYDVRFSELFLYYRWRKVDAILVPSAFLPETGKAHWETLLRARAIETQSYIVAPAQAGTHIHPNGASRTTYGRSMIIDPWGRILLDAGEQGVGIFEITLSKSLIDLVRRQIPMASHQHFYPKI